MTKGVYLRTSPEETSRKIAWLKDIQKKSLSTKIDISNEVIDQALKVGKPALLYSGGKDSTVLLYLLKAKCPNILTMYNDTGLGKNGLIEFIEEQTRGMNFIKTLAENQIEMWKLKGYYPILSKRGFTAYKKKFPNLRCSPVQCCYQLKEMYANKVLIKNEIKVVFWGNRAGESNRRMLSFADSGFLFKPKKYAWNQAYPLQHWTDEDIITFLKMFIPEFPLDRNFENGCLCCGTDLTFKQNTLKALYENNTALWEYYMNNGFAEQILIAKGIDISKVDVSDVIKTKPQWLLRI